MPTFTRKLSELIDESYDLGMGVDDYPIFDETYRVILNKKITQHYWNYEIGQETESMFRFSLNRKLNEIMPYYNQLYLSEQIQFDPLQTVNFTDSVTSSDTRNITDDSTNDSTTDNASKARVVSSETPQTLLSPNEDYASNAANTVSDATVTSNGTGNNTHAESGSATIEKTVLGMQGPSAAELLMRYRATFLNIDMMVISELEPLFMQIWDNGDEYSRSEGLSYGIGYGFIGLF